jgi:DNA repair exonuclease SbcCD ATPase subunit
MKQINFKNVVIENFKSIGDEPLILGFTRGINLITGINKDKDSRNGVGKSSIVEAIYWGLFGSSLKDLTNSQLVHGQSKKHCAVEMSFDVNGKNYIIKRELNPSKVYLEENGEDVTLSTIPATNEFIQKLLGVNEKVFTNAILMSINGTIPFMAQSKVDKRKFIEGILGLNIFSEMLKKARADYNETKGKNDVESRLFLEHQTNHKKYKEIYDNFELTRKNSIDKLKNDIKIVEEKITNKKKETKEVPKVSIEEIESKIKNIEEDIKKIEVKEKELTAKDREVYGKQQEIKQEIKQKENQIIQLRKKEGACPTCKRPFDNHNPEEIEKECSKVKEEISKLTGNLEKLDDAIKKLNVKKKDFEEQIDKKENEISKLKTEIKSVETVKLFNQNVERDVVNLESQIKHIQENIQSNEKLENHNGTLVKEIEDKIEVSKKTLEDIQKNLKILDTVKFIVSEEGVKAYILKKIITFINERLNYYLNLLEAPCICEFNETFEEKIINEEGKECSYHNFSAGEAKRIDFSILCMFQDLLKIQSGTTFNISIYDEILDSSIDGNGAEQILSILRNRVEENGECVYIVSHNSQTKSNIDNVIQLEKSNGVTKLVL